MVVLVKSDSHRFALELFPTTPQSTDFGLIHSNDRSHRAIAASFKNFHTRTLSVNQ